MERCGCHVPPAEALEVEDLNVANHTPEVLGLLAEPAVHELEDAATPLLAVLPRDLLGALDVRGTYVPDCHRLPLSGHQRADVRPHELAADLVLVWEDHGRTASRGELRGSPT